MVLQAIKYGPGKLQALDQTKLPHQEIFVDIENPNDAWLAIKSMLVRGAPAIAIVAALSLAVYLKNHGELDGRDHQASSGQCADFVIKSLKFLVTSRPTAVNLADAARKLEKVVSSAQREPGSSSLSVQEAYIQAAEKMLADDVQDNENIGKLGAEWIRKQSQVRHDSQTLSVLTHCNTGSLATAGYGTALGVIRSLHAEGALLRAFYTETRPYNQGSRLTGYELIHDGIPAKLITDSMAASLFKSKQDSDRIACVVVGADRVAANGDTANKIGTYSLAILARYHNVKFLVAAPRTTIDLSTASGADIIIEQRQPREVTSLKGPSIFHKEDSSIAINVADVHEVSIAAAGTDAWNPAFDVTPAELIDGIVTEKGVIEKADGLTFDFRSIFDVQKTLADEAKTDALLNGKQKPETLPTVSHDNLSWNFVLALKPSQIPEWTTWMQESVPVQF